MPSCLRYVFDQLPAQLGTQSLSLLIRQNEDYEVIALIGDGALTGGLAYEGLSNAGKCGQQILVILNGHGVKRVHPAPWRTAES